MASKKAIRAVTKAVRDGDLPSIGTQICVDCGKPAQHYDHRDYDKPLEVEPVCVKCNFARGPAKGMHDKDEPYTPKTEIFDCFDTEINEIQAMNFIVQSLWKTALSKEEMNRVINWVVGKYKLKIK